MRHPILKTISVLSLCRVLSMSDAHGATINIACTYNAITNALLSTAQEGDTVQIAAGDCVISNQITINRNISFTIAGAGSNSTTLRSAAGLAQAIWVVSSSSNLFSIHDLDLVGSAGNSGSFLIMGHPTGGFRGMYHIYNIQMTNVVTRGLSVGFGNAYGLVDHVYMVSVGTGSQFMDFEGAEYGSWTNAIIPFGTTNASYVEDCYFWNKGGGGNGFWDAYTGAQFVFRHNVCDGHSAAGGHGYDSGAISPRTWEIYNNLFTNLPNGDSILSQRGGTGVVFSNLVVGLGSNNKIFVPYFRGCPTDHPYPTETGYLLTGQPGKGYLINFNNTTYGSGLASTYPGNPTNNQTIQAGFATYTFLSDLRNCTFNMANKNGYGGGAVQIGGNVAQTISNFYAAVNLVPSGYGTAYSNWNGMAYPFGHDFIAIGLNSTNLILTNVLDGNSDSFGYPANQQCGVVTSYPNTGTNFVNNQALWPAYAWSNVVNGAVQGFELDNDSCGNWTANLVKINRDFFNSKPATATYTPLVYPHPLQSLTSVDPQITIQPQNQTTSLGSTATFTVTASGLSALSYQWSKNGSAIGGATASSYTTPATTCPDNGSTFFVAVTDNAGTINSLNAILTVTGCVGTVTNYSSRIGSAQLGTVRF